MRSLFIYGHLLMITLISFFIFWVINFLFAFLFFLFIGIFIQISFKFFNVFNFLLNKIMIKSALYTDVHLIHDMGKLAISVFLKPRVFTDYKSAFSLNTIPTFSKHVLFLLFGFFFESRLIWCGFGIFGKYSNNGFLGLNFQLIKCELRNELINVDFVRLLFVKSLSNFNL